MDLEFDKSPLSFATGICLRLAFNQCTEGNIFKISSCVVTLKRDLFIRKAPLVFKTREGHMFNDSRDYRSLRHQQIRMNCSPISAH